MKSIRLATFLAVLSLVSLAGGSAQADPSVPARAALVRRAESAEARQQAAQSRSVAQARSGKMDREPTQRSRQEKMEPVTTAAARQRGKSEGSPARTARGSRR